MEIPPGQIRNRLQQTPAILQFRGIMWDVTSDSLMLVWHNIKVSLHHVIDNHQRIRRIRVPKEVPQFPSPSLWAAHEGTRSNRQLIVKLFFIEVVSIDTIPIHGALSLLYH
ncbi:AAEL012668-PA [Aedes aegypti]|uniref:AAEL012668-PA n=1 Tax=Aedes aegypti TaxID=7159 RepID=Q16LF4_AEDAE|nr:AAEL012668-PA [Aedes aegypti]